MSMTVSERVEHKCSTESMCNKLNATNAYNDMTSVSALSTKKKKEEEGARSKENRKMAQETFKSHLQILVALTKALLPVYTHFMTTTTL